MQASTHSDPDIVYDAERQSVTFCGPSGQLLLYAILTRAKFGERFDSDLILNERVGKLINVLVRNLPSAVQIGPSGPFTPADLQEIAVRLVKNGKAINWWGMSLEKKREFLRDVVATPHKLDDDQVEFVIDAADDLIGYYEKLIAERRDHLDK